MTGRRHGRRQISDDLIRRGAGEETPGNLFVSFPLPSSLVEVPRPHGIFINEIFLQLPLPSCPGGRLFPCPHVLYAPLLDPGRLFPAADVDMKGQ